MKTVIIYTTRYGCTEKAAGMLKNKLEGEVDLVNLTGQIESNLDGYDRVILGGSIYIGQIQKQIKEYANRHLEQLQHKKIGLFICAGRPEPELLEKELNDAFPRPLLDQALARGFFGYEYDFAKLKLFDKMIVRKVVGLKESKFQISEDAIASFAGRMNSA